MSEEWIDINEQLPEWYTWVFVWSEHFERPLETRRVETGDKDENGESKWKWDWSKYVGLFDMGVGHWQPLPKGPER